MAHKELSSAEKMNLAQLALEKEHRAKLERVSAALAGILDSEGLTLIVTHEIKLVPRQK
jgi:hypothetical protein